MNLIVLAGEYLPPDFAHYVARADFIIAADGGAHSVLPFRVPDLIVGDGDSIAPDRFHEIEISDDQETTDCEKALLAAEKRGFEAVTLIGVEGSRLDHVLATLFACASSSLSISLVLQLGTGRVLRGGDSVSLPLPVGTLFSVMPLSECVVSLEGAEWPLALAKLSPVGMKSISNRSVGELKVQVTSGNCLLLVHQ